MDPRIGARCQDMNGVVFIQMEPIDGNVPLFAVLTQDATRVHEHFGVENNGRAEHPLKNEVHYPVEIAPL
jgi:hypothetical protein